MSESASVADALHEAYDGESWVDKVLLAQAFALAAVLDGAAFAEQPPALGPVSKELREVRALIDARKPKGASALDELAPGGSAGAAGATPAGRRRRQSRAEGGAAR